MKSILKLLLTNIGKEISKLLAKALDCVLEITKYLHDLLIQKKEANDKEEQKKMNEKIDDIVDNGQIDDLLDLRK